MQFRRESLAYRLADVFFRNWVLFTLCVVGVTGVVTVALLTRGETYVSTASIRINRDNTMERALGIAQRSWDSPAQQNAAQFNDLMIDILPTGFVSKVLARAELKTPMNMDPRADDKRFRAFRQNVFAKPRSNDVFDIGLVWEDGPECERLVEALRNCYIENVGIMKQSDSVAASGFLDSQIEIYQKRLQEAERALQEYKRLNAGKLPEAQQGEAEQLSNLKMERDYLVITSQDNGLKRQAIEQRLKRIKPVSVSEQTVSTDPMILQIRELQAKRNSLLAQDWRPDSIPVQEVDSQIARLENERAAKAKADPNQAGNVVETKLQDNPEYIELTSQLTQAVIDERAQKARIVLIEKQIAEYDARLKLLPQAERKLVEKLRDRDVVKKQWENLYQRREEALLKANVDAVTAKSVYSNVNPIYAEPTLGTAKKLFMVIGSGIVGVIVGFAVILLKEWSDPTLRYESDVARLLGVPVLACLPDSAVLQFPTPGARHGRLLGAWGGGPPKQLTVPDAPTKSDE